MGKGSARLFQQAPSDAFEQNWNIVELTTRKRIRQKVNALLRLASDETITRSDVRQELLQCVATFGDNFTTQLVRALQRDNHEERQSIVWLLTVLDARETIPPLQQMSNDTSLPRALRLSASLALAGMGVTAETIKQNRRIHLYALS